MIPERQISFLKGINFTLDCCLTWSVPRPTPSSRRHELVNSNLESHLSSTLLRHLQRGIAPSIKLLLSALGSTDATLIVPDCLGRQSVFILSKESAYLAGLQQDQPTITTSSPSRFGTYSFLTSYRSSVYYALISQICSHDSPATTRSNPPGM